MPTIEQGCILLEAAEAMIEAARKAYPNADDAMIKVSCDSAIAITLGTATPQSETEDELDEPFGNSEQLPD